MNPSLGIISSICLTPNKISIRWATNMSSGACQNGKDSESKRLGVKKFGSEHVRVSEVIVRQRGKKWYPGENVGVGSDDTLFSKMNGTVQFRKDPLKKKTVVYVMPHPGKDPRKFDMKLVHLPFLNK